MERRRYSLRPGSVALTRAQWVAAAVALVVAVVGGLVAFVAVGPGAAGIVTGLAGVTMALIIGFGHGR
ncbi:hypothetical protein [Micromonospora mirobrigensis]|uniref:Uncharacterized protein n=1 Tax=Micromonospora mirobrigensis TaxID=262898 RepID=A0A1C4YNQ1_9ACTN|nr:hypothetical protein [Micromonospora mirobrigensis]SCF22316.1 hypothetical protein GA0070564_104241 [Micromonospora mirobrigensis]